MFSSLCLFEAQSNPAINKWILCLTTEADRLNKFNAFILRDKIASLAKAKFIAEMSKELTILSAEKSLSRRISIHAPIKSSFAKFRFKGYTHPLKDKAMENSDLGFHTDT